MNKPPNCFNGKDELEFYVNVVVVRSQQQVGVSRTAAPNSFLSETRLNTF